MKPKIILAILVTTLLTVICYQTVSLTAPAFSSEPENITNPAHLSEPEEEVSYKVIDVDFPYYLTRNYVGMGGRGISVQNPDGSKTNTMYRLAITTKMAKSMPKFDFTKGVIPLTLKQASRIANKAFEHKKGYKPSVSGVYLREFHVAKNRYYYDFQNHSLRLVVLPDGNVVYEKPYFTKTIKSSSEVAK